MGVALIPIDLDLLSHILFSGRGRILSLIHQDDRRVYAKVESDEIPQSHSIPIYNAVMESIKVPMGSVSSFVRFKPQD